MRRKDSYRKWYKKSILVEQNFEDESKDRDSNFLVMYSNSYWERRRDYSLMLVTICYDTWNMINMQHITPNLKRWGYSDIPGGGTKMIKGFAHMVQGNQHLRKRPNSLPPVMSKIVKSFLLEHNELPHTVNSVAPDVLVTQRVWTSIALALA